jgi:vanillate O-demethylase monooxygenase subunit
MHYTRNDWYVACTEQELAQGGPVACCILDERLVAWGSENAISVLEDRCVHRAAALSLGRCEGANLRCMYHGLVFDGDGVVVEIPGQDLIPQNARVRSYPATVRHGWVWVWMGDPADADLSLVPDLFAGIDLGAFAIGHGVLDFAAEARLISDNLLDFSHLPFVHANSFQSPPDWAKSTMKMEQLERGMRFERWIEKAPGNYLFDPQPAEPFDSWLGYDYRIPGILLMWSGNFRAGTASALDFGRPDFSQAIGQVLTNIQAITPMTERSSRYHFTVGAHRELGRGAEIIDRLVSVTTQAFGEDKVMIEAQQEVLDRDPGRPIMPTVHDRGVTQFNRLKAKLIAAEGGVSALV